MSDYSSDEEFQPGIIARAKDASLAPLRPLVSKPARRAYLSTLLIATAAFVLAGVAIIAYIAFYLSYIPTRGFTRPIHLQFAPGEQHHPYGIAQLSRELVSEQPYDVRVELHMPRTPENRNAGNFMLDLSLFGPGTEQSELVRERRPAILTYHSEPLEYVHKVLQLPWYLLGWRREAETLRVSMMESVEFTRGWKHIPATAKLEVQSKKRLQVYSVELVFTTKFRGLRYIMYNHRIISFVVFTTAFWVVEMVAAMLAWGVLSYIVFPGTDSSQVIKQEPTETDGKPIKAETDDGTIDDMSDTSRTFPTYGRQPPLRYSSPRIKEEGEDEPVVAPLAAGEAADDEDESDDFVLDETGAVTGAREAGHDSGIGTSMESSAEHRDTVRRRKSGGIGGDK